MRYGIFFALVLLPAVTHAQDGLQEWLLDIINFANDRIIPFLFALAFLFFIWNAFRFFILSGDSQEGRQKAKQLMLWGLIALVLMMVVWGVVNLFVDALGFDRTDAIVPDYLR